MLMQSAKLAVQPLCICTALTRPSVQLCYIYTTGMAGGLRASGPKADLALIVADADAVAAGVFTTNVMCAAPVLYCKQVLAKNKPARAVSTL